jgi:hypothetical protein
VISKSKFIMQKSKCNFRTEAAGLAISIVNLANAIVNRANAQSRPSGILFAQANGKLCFDYTETFPYNQNPLPLQGAKTLPKSAFLEYILSSYELAAFFQRH